MNKLRVGIVGAGKRVNYLYGPLIRLLKDDLDLVGICSRRMETAQAVADIYQVPAFDDVDKLVEGAHPDHLIVSVTHAANGEVGRQLGRRHRAATSRASSGNTPSYRLRTAPGAFSTGPASATVRQSAGNDRLASSRQRAWRLATS